MDVSTQPGVIGQVPTEMVGIVRNHDLARIPKQVIAVAIFVRRRIELIDASDSPRPAVKRVCRRLIAFSFPGAGSEVKNGHSYT